MPIALKPAEELPLPKWERPAKTTHDLDWADIKVLDLSTFDTPGGKEKLAEELRDAVRTKYQICRLGGFNKLRLSTIWFDPTR